MSISYSAFVKEFPSTTDLQQYINQAKLAITLLKSIEVSDYRGFIPMRLASDKAGVEIYLDDFDPTLFTEITSPLGDRKKIITFSFGGEASTACCAFGLAAALAKFGDALIYGDGFLTYEQITANGRALRLNRRLYSRAWTW